MVDLAKNNTHIVVASLKEKVHDYQTKERYLDDSNNIVAVNLTDGESPLESLSSELMERGLNSSDERFHQSFLSVALDDEGLSDMELENMLRRFGDDNDKDLANKTKYEQVLNMESKFESLNETFEPLYVDDTEASDGSAPTQSPTGGRRKLVKYVYNPRRKSRDGEMNSIRKLRSPRKLLGFGSFPSLREKTNELVSAFPMHSDFLLRRLSAVSHEQCRSLNCTATSIEGYYGTIETSVGVITPLLGVLADSLDTIETFSRSLGVSESAVNVVKSIINVVVKIPGFGSTMETIKKGLDPFILSFKKVVGKFTDFVEKHSRQWLSKIDQVLEAVTKGHVLLGTVASMTRTFADLGQNMCIRGVTAQLSSFDLFGKLENAGAAFLDSISSTATLFSGVANALRQSPFKEIQSTLDYIGEKFLPVINALEPLEMLGGLLSTKISIPWIRLPYVVTKVGPSKCAQGYYK